MRSARPHACPPTDHGVRNTSEPCRATTGGLDASQRAGETAQHRRSAARGGPCPRAPRASGGWVAPRDRGKAGGAEHPRRRPRARLLTPRQAGAAANPLPPPPQRASARPKRRSQSTRGLAGLCHQCGAHAAVFAACGVGLAARRPRGTPLPPPQEPGPSRAAVCQAPRATCRPHVPADAWCACVHGHGVCPSTVSRASAGQTPRFAPREQAKEDRHAYGGAEPTSGCGGVADDHQEGCRRGHPAAADTPGSVTGGDPATAGVRGFTLRAACNAGNGKLMRRMVSLYCVAIGTLLSWSSLCGIAVRSRTTARTTRGRVLVTALGIPSLPAVAPRPAPRSG